MGDKSKPHWVIYMRISDCFGVLQYRRPSRTVYGSKMEAQKAIDELKREAPFRHDCPVFSWHIARHIPNCGGACDSTLEEE